MLLHLLGMALLVLSLVFAILFLTRDVVTRDQGSGGECHHELFTFSTSRAEIASAGLTGNKNFDGRVAAGSDLCLGPSDSDRPCHDRTRCETDGGGHSAFCNANVALLQGAGALAIIGIIVGGLALVCCSPVLCAGCFSDKNNRIGNGVVMCFLVALIWFCLFMFIAVMLASCVDRHITVDDFSKPGALVFCYGDYTASLAIMYGWLSVCIQAAVIFAFLRYSSISPLRQQRSQQTQTAVYVFQPPPPVATPQPQPQPYPYPYPQSRQDTTTTIIYPYPAQVAGTYHNPPQGTPPFEGHRHYETSL